MLTKLHPVLDFGMGRRGHNVSQKMYRRGEFIKVSRAYLTSILAVISIGLRRDIQWSVAIYMLEIAAPAIIKISILLLYLRLFSASRKMRLATYFLLAFCTAYMVAFLLALGFGCRPLRKLVNPTIPGKCVSFNRHVRVQAYVNAVTDILVFLLPIPLAIRLQLPTRQKVALVLMFGIGSMYVFCPLVSFYIFPCQSGLCLNPQRRLTTELAPALQPSPASSIHTAKAVMDRGNNGRVFSGREFYILPFFLTSHFVC